MNLEPTLSFALTPEIAAEEAARLKSRFPFIAPEDLCNQSKYQRPAGALLKAESVTALNGSKVLPEGVSVTDFAGTVVAEFFYANETYYVLQTGDLVNWDAGIRESADRIYKALTEDQA